MALASPDTQDEITPLGALFDTLDALPPEILRVNMQKALKGLESRTDTYSKSRADFLEQSSITGTQVVQVYALSLDENVENGVAWQRELQAIAPTIFRSDFDVTKLSDPAFLAKAVRIYLVDIKIPIFEAITSRAPLFHDPRALIVLVGDEPRAGKMIVSTRIYPKIAPQNDDEAGRYGVTHAPQENDLPKTFDAFLGNIAYALSRTISAELKVLKATTISLVLPRP